MEVSHRFCFVFFAIFAAAAFHGTNAATIVSGMVFCDQCKDGHLSYFDYPLSGINVTLAFPGPDKEVIVVGEGTTNWFGSYSIKFDGEPDLSSCFVHVSGSNLERHNCSAAAGPPQKLRKVFKIFSYTFYSVESLLSQPLQPMPFCPKPTRASLSTRPVPDPVSPVAPPPLSM